MSSLALPERKYDEKTIGYVGRPHLSLHGRLRPESCQLLCRVIALAEECGCVDSILSNFSNSDAVNEASMQLCYVWDEEKYDCRDG